MGPIFARFSVGENHTSDCCLASGVQPNTRLLHRSRLTQAFDARRIDVEELAISVILVLVGLINFGPVAGVFSSQTLSKAYGIDEPTGDLALLLRHRAALFGIVGGLIIVAAFVEPLQVAAVIMGYLSMLSFVALAASVGPVGAKLTRVRNIDVAAIVLLTCVPAIWAFQALVG